MLSDSGRLELPEHGHQVVSVGRAAERDQFVRLIEDEPGSNHVLAVSGEPGIGKTRLVNDFVGLAASRGWRVVGGYAVRQPGGKSFGTLVDVLAGSGCHSCGYDVDGPSGDGACPLISVASRSVRDTRRTEPVLACDVLDLLDAGGRVLLVIDDLHRADDATVDVLPRLARLPVPGRLLVVVAYRPRQARFSVWRMLAVPEAGARSTHIALTPLRDEEAGQLLPGELTPYQRMALVHLAKGNPGLLRGLVASGRSGFSAIPVEDEDAGWLRDFDGLSVRGWLVLRSAALLGEPFEVEPLEQVAQLSRGDVLVALDELVRDDLVRWEPYGRALRFRDPLIGAMADRSAGPEWRVAAGLRAAAALPAGAVPALRRQSLSEGWDAGRPDQLPFVAGSVEHVVPAREDGLERELLLGESLVTSGGLAEGLAVFADLANRADRAPVVRARVAWWRAWTWRLLGEQRKAYRELGAALDDLPHDEDVLRARLARARLAVVLEHSANSEDVDEAAKDVAETVYTAFGATARVLALALLAVRDVRRGYVERAELLVSQAVPWLGEMTGGVVERLDALAWLGVAAVGVSRPDVAAWCHRRGLGLADRYGITSAVPWFAMWLAEAEVADGELVQAAWHRSLAREVAAYLRSDHLLDAVASMERAADRTARRRAVADTEEPDRPLTHLSRRELDIARLVGDGQTNQQIARSLGLSPKTVETYLARIFKKLGASSRSQVAAEIGRAQAIARSKAC